MREKRGRGGSGDAVSVCVCVWAEEEEEEGGYIVRWKLSSPFSSRPTESYLTAKNESGLKMDLAASPFVALKK